MDNKPIDQITCDTMDYEYVANRLRTVQRELPLTLEVHRAIENGMKAIECLRASTNFWSGKYADADTETKDLHRALTSVHDDCLKRDGQIAVMKTGILKLQEEKNALRRQLDAYQIGPGSSYFPLVNRLNKQASKFGPPCETSNALNEAAQAIQILEGAWRRLGRENADLTAAAAKQKPITSPFETMTEQELMAHCDRQGWSPKLHRKGEWVATWPFGSDDNRYTGATMLEALRAAVKGRAAK